MSFSDSFKSRIVRVLRRSEKYTKTDMVYLASGGFWSIVGQASAALIAFVLAIAMARLVPKEVYGEYKYILAVVAILGTFSLNNVAGAVLISTARGFRSALTDGFWANLRWSIAVFLGALGIGAYYMYQGNMVLGLGVLIGGCISPFLSGFNLYGSFLIGAKDFRRATWYSDFLTNLIPMISLVAVAFIAPSPLSLLTTYFISNVLAAAYAYWRSLQLYGIRDSHDQNMVSYGKHLSLMGVLSGIASNLDQLLLFHFAGPLNLAVYNFAIAIPDQSKGPLKMLDNMIQARFTNRSTDEVSAGMLNKMLWLLLLAITFIILYMIAAPYLYSWFFPAYTDAIYLSQIYVISQIGLIFAPAGSFLAATKKVREQYVSTIGISIFQIISMVIGVIYGGLLGLIIARVMVRILGPAFNFVLYIWAN